MPSREPDAVLGPTPLHQTWLHTTFVHWPYEPELVRGFVPRGLDLDLADGVAWVTLTPFGLQPRAPGWARQGFPVIPETNLRTYVVAEDDRDGILFLSLDIANALLALVGRTVVPYHWASARLEQGDAVLHYEGRRRPGGDASYRLRVAPGDPADVSPLDDFLTGRWRAYTRRGPILMAVPVRHQPWPLHRAELLELDETLTTTAGLPAPSATPLVQYAPRVDAVLGLPRPASGSH